MGANEQPIFSKEGWLADNLKKGEIYAGIILGKNGERDYHLVALPEGKKADWAGAHDQAKKIDGASVLSRREGRLAQANVPEHFKTDDWYWLAEESAGHGDYAWAQYFSRGSQDSVHKRNECRVRLVRRVFI